MSAAGTREAVLRLPVGLERPRRDAVTALSVYALLLFVVPSRLVFAGVNFDVTPAMLVGGVALLWWANARMVPSLGAARGHQPVRVALYLFVAAIVASYAAAGLRAIEGDEIASADRHLATLTFSLGVGLLAADGIDSRRRLHQLLDLLVKLGVLIACIGISQFVTGLDITGLFRIPGLRATFELSFIGERSFFRRPAGTALHPIEFGVVLAMLLPLALSFAFAAPRGKAFWRWAGVAAIAIGLLMSLSRSGVLGVIMAALVVFPAWPRRRKLRALLVTPVFLVVMRLLVPGLLGTISGLFANITSDPSYQGRTDDYSVVGRFISESPWFGRGFGTFLPDKYILLDNQYLGVLIEAGIFGMVTLLLLFLIAIFTARGARRRSGDPFDRDVAQSLAAAMVCAMVSFATFDAFGFPMVTGLTFLLAGCCGALWRLAGEGADDRA